MQAFAFVLLFCIAVGYWMWLKGCEQIEQQRSKPMPDHLKDKVKDSILRNTVRGIRRYFPLTAKDKDGWQWAEEAYYIIYGEKPVDNLVLGYAILNTGLGDYVEEFNGKLWVRTILI